VQRAIGPRSSGAGRPHRRGGAASFGFCRSGGASAWGRAGVLGVSISSPSTWPFVAMLTGVPPDAPESRVDRERTDVSDLLQWRARRLPERSDPWLQKGAPPSLARRHPNVKKRRSGWTYYIRRRNSALDVFLPHDSVAVRGVERRSVTRWNRTTARRRAGRTPGISGRRCRAVALLWRGAPVSDPE
jgi:hypothetical protein